MNKLGAVLIVIGIVGACYLLLLVAMPILTDFASTANTTIAADVDDLSAYPGATSGLLAAPWVLFFVPGVIGMIVIVIICRSP